MVWRLEVWTADIDLRSCSADDYDAAVSCSDPHEILVSSRSSVDAWLDAKERLHSEGARVRTAVEVHVYRGKVHMFAYRRDRDGRFVPHCGKAAIA